jgi:chromosome segregation ATPase
MRDDILQIENLKKNIDSLEKKVTGLEQVIALKTEELKKQKDSLEFECQKRVFAREKELDKEKANEIKLIQDDLTKEVNRYQEKYEKTLTEKDKLISANYELQTTLEREHMDKERRDAELSSKNKEIEELRGKINQLEN